jgi:hypothetical protein
MLTEILARHAPAPNGHVDWTKLGEFFRIYRKMDPKSRRTHRLMAHMGTALARAFGSDVWDTLAELRFPVDRSTEGEIDELLTRGAARLRSLTARRDWRGLLALADRADPAFVARRARYRALKILVGAGRGDSEEAEAVRRRLGVIDRYHVIGPFYARGGPGLAYVFPPEEELDLEAEYATGQGVARWKVPDRAAEHFARIDGNGIVRLRYAYPEGAVTYALAHVTVPEETEALAYVGEDDEAALWVNGRHVQRNHGLRGTVQDQEMWPVTLAAGRNRVLLKVANHGGATGFCLSLVRTDGRPIEELTQDLMRPGRLPVAAREEPKWGSVLEDSFGRKSLGRRYRVAAGHFRIKKRALYGEASGGRPGWRPFSVRPGFPQDRPAALLWLAPPKKEVPRDFRWQVRLAEPRVPKLALTWDGEGEDLPLSGWSLVLVPSKKTFTARVERYDYLHYLKVLDAPKSWDGNVLSITRHDGKLEVRLGGTEVFREISVPPLRRRRFGLAVWGKNPAIDGIALALPK